MKIAVIGAGAAGLVAAGVAAETLHNSPAGGQVVVFEKNRKPGVKILMSGGTRCNLTHDCSAAGIMQAFGRQGRFLRQALAEFSPRDVVAMFTRLGVPTHVEPGGKIFPTSGRALHVRDALVRRATTAGAELHRDAPVTSIRPLARGVDELTDTGGGRFEVVVMNQALVFDAVIVTVGGQSYPGCGTTGDGYAWLRCLGHTIQAPRPALVPLVGGTDWMRQISGVTLADVSLSVLAAPTASGQAKRKPLMVRRGGFLFTHFGFSGPAPMDISGLLTRCDPPGNDRPDALPSDGCPRSLDPFAVNRQRAVSIDLLPRLSRAELAAWLAGQRAQGGRRQLATALAELLPKRLARAITEPLRAAETPLAELSKATASELIDSLKSLPLEVTGSRGFAKAEVTSGGVLLSEIDPRTMESRRLPGLYVAGELLDLDGWIGGYNFQAAFSTGHVAGRCAATGSQP